MDSLLDEITRVNSVIENYRDPILKGAGLIAASCMASDVRKAKEAIGSGDVVEMLRIHEVLKGWEA